jgi:hypothetical protein
VIVIAMAAVRERARHEQREDEEAHDDDFLKGESFPDRASQVVE